MKSLEEIVRELTPEKLSQINTIRRNIDRKIAEGIPLTEEEKDVHCEQRTWSIKSQLSECEDEFFREFMLKNDPNFPLYHEITADNHIRFGAILVKWDRLMTLGNLADLIIKAERKEFRYELWQLKREVPNKAPEFSSRYLRLLEWSKFRSIAVRRIFKKNIKLSEIEFTLNKETIIFNYESLTHIIARHFAHGVKPYFTNRDHFYGIFAPDELHKSIGQFLESIDKSNLYLADSIQEINFRYQRDIYRINTKVEIYFEQGKTGAQKRNRLTTFFRLSEMPELEKLKDHFIEKRIDKHLSVFVST